MKALICFVSQQSAPNMNSVGHINPDKVILMTTAKMKGNAEALANELKQIGKKSEEVAIDNESSLVSLTEQYENWLNDNLNNYDEIIVNITGGNKLMSLTAYDVFRGWGRCFYQNIDSDELIWLDDESIVSNIGHNIGLERYLGANRFQVDNRQKVADIPKNYKLYADMMHEELCYPQRYDSMLSLIGKINAHVADAKLDLSNFKFDASELKFLTDLSNETGVFSLKNGVITCDNPADRAFVGGGWLEVLTAISLQGKGYRDISQSVEISRSTQRSGVHMRQEIDVMAMQENTLVIIECKTKKWHPASEASGAIYKLSSLGDIGGIKTKAIFVSLHGLPASAKTRAAEMGIQVIDGENGIKRLKKSL